MTASTTNQVNERRPRERLRLLDSHPYLDDRGRFKAGNPGGTGCPVAARVARLRAALLGAVTPEDLKAVVVALVTRAKTGDLAAIHELLDRLLGKPIEADILERLQDLEDRLLKESTR